MIVLATCIDFRSLRRLERSSPASFGLLSLCLFRFTLYSWRLLRGSVDCEDLAYGIPDSFISKSCFLHRMPFSQYISFPFQCFLWRSGVWTNICTFSIPMWKNFYITRVQELVRIDHSNISIYKYIQVWAIMLDSNNHSLQSFNGFTLSVISFYGIYFFCINANNLIITSISKIIK